MDMSLLTRFRRRLRMTRRGGWVYVLLMPWFVPLTAYLFVGEPYLHNGQTFVSTTLLAWLILTVSVLTQDWIGNKIVRRYPELRQTIVRALLLLVSCMGISIVFITAFGVYFIRFHPFDAQLTYDKLPLIYSVNLVIVLLLIGIYETTYALYRWQQYQMNKEKLRKENLRGQLQSLRSQVSPHFLFNSLNSLSSLISEEPQRAEQFVDQMARVYRYMLQANHRSNQLPKAGRQPTGIGVSASLFDDPIEEDELTTLAEELTFIDSYYHLLKTRHGDGLRLTVHIDEQYRACRLPPLTLQLLVENAVKHNVILASRPLHIEIRTTEEGTLIVRNNLQKKNTRPNPSGEEPAPVGLANIQAKYQLLDYHMALAIETGPDYFTVTLPLVAKNRITA